MVGFELSISLSGPSLSPLLVLRADYITEVKMIKTGKGIDDVSSSNFIF